MVRRKRARPRTRVPDGYARAPRPALAPLTALRSELSKRDPSYFNDAENFKDSTAEALDVQREARGSPFSGPPALPS